MFKTRRYVLERRVGKNTRAPMIAITTQLRHASLSMKRGFQLTTTRVTEV